MRGRLGFGAGQYWRALSLCERRMSSIRGSAGAAPVNAALRRSIARVAAISRADRGGSPVCEARNASTSGSSGIALLRKTREDLAIKFGVRLPGLASDDATVASYLLTGKCT